jgi:hypothetical protein
MLLFGTQRGEKWCFLDAGSLRRRNWIFDLTLHQPQESKYLSLGVSRISLLVTALLFGSAFAAMAQLIAGFAVRASSKSSKCDGRPKIELLKPLEIINSVNLDKILNKLKTLTPREHEVLNQVVSGRLNKEIASELGITERKRGPFKVGFCGNVGLRTCRCCAPNFPSSNSH